MAARDPAWSRRRRPDQRRRSGLGKTFGLRMDGISVWRPFPLGSLVLGPGDRVTTRKKDDMKGGGGGRRMLICMRWALSLPLCPPPRTPPPPCIPSSPLLLTLLSSRPLSISVSLPKLRRSNTPPNPPKLLCNHHLTLIPNPSPRKNTQAPSQRINRKP